MSQRDDLLAGAKKCLVEKGYSRTTARDIAAASGAHLASIGYHFGSKDKLMNAAIIEATSEWGDRVEEAVRQARATDPPQRLRTMLAHLFAATREDRELLVAGVQPYSQAQFDEELRSTLATGFREARVAIAAMILGIAPEEVDEEAEQGIGGVTYNLVLGYIMQALVDPESIPDVDTAVAAIQRLAGDAAG
ncbi:TetR family transcriptional regulator [Stackebrandtia endophytica]|uniref:TetR family transcriptional regulator n=1 Tax=Stackebrandtia endophytica TaxID=1496996 RepID=A0A543AZ39_9ACTN|nr:TetR/AcrR family transcriptional regulator [Stackebrandtia endophytica]TQL77838.1 TetR family transcriptional regulator [Stackebrandtia endophytica]